MNLQNYIEKVDVHHLIILSLSNSGLPVKKIILRTKLLRRLFKRVDLQFFDVLFAF